MVLVERMPHLSIVFAKSRLCISILGWGVLSAPPRRKTWALCPPSPTAIPLGLSVVPWETKGEGARYRVGEPNPHRRSQQEKTLEQRFASISLPLKQPRAAAVQGRVPWFDISYDVLTSTSGGREWLVSEDVGTHSGVFPSGTWYAHAWRTYSKCPSSPRSQSVPQTMLTGQLPGCPACVLLLLFVTPSPANIKTT